MYCEGVIKITWIKFKFLTLTLHSGRGDKNKTKQDKTKQNKIYNTDFPHIVIHFTLMLNIFKQQSLLEKM